MRQAFSLVELSIVLVILGLLTGGILAGQSLIRAAELRSVVADYQRYTAAGNTFRDKYMGIAGDFRDGTRFWGRMTTVAATACTTNSAAAVGTPGTCDGDGNGQIDYPGAASASGESFQYWKQLANAGLIEGNYSGTANASASNGHTIGTNAPAGRISSSIWSIWYRGTTAGGAGVFYAGDYGNELSFFIPSSTGTATVVLRPEELWNIDMKLDDGKPGRGRIRAIRISTCTTSGSAAGSQNDLDGSYLLTWSDLGCVISVSNAI